MPHGRKFHHKSPGEILSEKGCQKGKKYAGSILLLGFGDRENNSGMRLLYEYILRIPVIFSVPAEKGGNTFRSEEKTVALCEKMTRNAKKMGGNFYRSKRAESGNQVNISA